MRGRHARRRRWPRRVARAAAAFAVVAVLLVLAFIWVGPLLLPYDAFALRSGSMAPTIPKGSLIVATETRSSSLRVGDVITFRVPGLHGRVTHRIGRIDEGDGTRVLVTKGDHNATADPWRLRVSGRQLRYREHVAGVGYVFIALATGWGRAGLVLVAVVVAAAELRRLVR